MIEGAKHIFRKDPKGKDNIDDVYESVSNEIARLLNVYRTKLINHAYNDFAGKNYACLVGYY